jgi:hypothetical protein
VGAVAPVKIGTGQGNLQWCELQDVLGQELGALIVSGCKRKERLTWRHQRRRQGWRGGSASREEGTAATLYRRRELERRCTHVKTFPGPRYGCKTAATCGLYGGVGIGWPARRRERVARAGWVRKVVDAPPNAPALAAWFPWDLEVRAGPTARSPRRWRACRAQAARTLRCRVPMGGWNFDLLHFNCVLLKILKHK